MTEFETATIAFQSATLAARHAGLWIAAAHVAVGLGQIAVVWYGIRVMQRMGQARAREQDQRHEEAMTALGRRHEETMTALGRRHEEAMTALDRRHEEAMTVFADQRRALEALIERTAPAPGAAR